MLLYEIYDLVWRITGLFQLQVLELRRNTHGIELVDGDAIIDVCAVGIGCVAGDIRLVGIGLLVVQTETAADPVYGVVGVGVVEIVDRRDLAVIEGEAHAVAAAEEVVL